MANKECVWWESSADGERQVFPMKLGQKTSHGEKASYRNTVVAMFTRVFLPVGYPDSVRPEYLEYQAYDSLQGVCSYLRMVLTTKSIFAGAGVGDASATPLAAALSWVLKDGYSIIGTLFFAYNYSDAFENNVKEWRLLADCFNNIGLTIDLMTGFAGRNYFWAFASLSTLFKALCGLIAGATKARIATHFARKGHLADVISKESTQETAVTLVGLVLGIALSQLGANDEYVVCTLFFVLLLVHQWANYKLVKTLVFDTISTQAVYLITKSSMQQLQSTSLAAPSPQQLSKSERLWLPLYLARSGLRFGASMFEIRDGVSAANISWSRLCTQLWGGGISTYCVYGLSRTGSFVVCLSKSVDSAQDDTAKSAAYIIGFAAFFLFEEEMHRENAPQSMEQKLNVLIEKVGPRCQRLFPRLVALAQSMAKSGWDVHKGSSRLGESGMFRYSNSTNGDRSRSRSKSKSRGKHE